MCFLHRGQSGTHQYAQQGRNALGCSSSAGLRYSTHLLLLAFVGIAAGVALGYTGSANWVILFLPCVWAVLTCRDTGMGKPLLLFTLGLAVLDAIIKQTAFLESFSLSNFLWNLASGCILYAVLGGIGWLIGWLLHYAKESTHENKE